MWRYVLILVCLLVVFTGLMCIRSTRDTFQRLPASGHESEQVAVGQANESEVAPRSLHRLLPVPPAETTGARIARMLNSSTIDPAHRLAPVEIMEYLARHKTNAFSLVAAFGATGDKSYLKLAAERFPDDPLVQTRVLLHNLFPEERQQWIDRLKESSPDNSLPYLLSASDRFEAGDVNGALEEMNHAHGKEFNDFNKEMAVANEEAYLGAGRNPAVAKALGTAEVLLPHLSQMKRLGIAFVEKAAEYGNSGDAASQQTLLEAAWELSKQLRDDGREGVVLNELVGLALENATLRAWPEDMQAPFLDKSPADQLAENERFRADIREMEGTLNNWLPAATENEIIAYFERLRTFGELDAMRWLINQRSGAAQ